MKKQVQIFLAGAILIIPLAATAYLAWWAGSKMDSVVRQIVPSMPPGVGVLVILVGIYLTGMLARFWAFRGLFRGLERLVMRLPGINTVYESIRDLMKLFGGDAKNMGRAISYKLPGTDVSVLGILTNDNPFDLPEGHPDRKVAIFLPFSYMFGGPTIYVSPGQVQAVDMSVEQVLKVCTTAHTAAGTVIRQAR